MRSNLFRRVIALLVIVVGLLLIVLPIWVFCDTTDATRRILVGSGIAALLFGVGALGLTTILEGVLLLRKKRHQVSPGDIERKADK
jgi:hypothetical protein